MLNFRSASIFMAILAFMVFLLMDARIEALWIILPLTVIYLLILVVGSVRISSGFYLQVLCKGTVKEKVVALTFDDGPDPVITPRVLEILEKHQIPATFFVIGRKAKNQEDLIRLIISKGHNIGNHSFSHHFLFDLFKRKNMEQDLVKAEMIIKDLSGKKPLLFRPPYGVTNPVLAKVVKRLGYQVIGWSIRSFDTTKKDAQKVTKRVIKGLHPGAVILMHDAQAVAPKALENIIIKAKEQGYRFVGLDEIFGIELK
jgi:peptidoglycan-N-acetylglucosamine deacetylase